MALGRGESGREETLEGEETVMRGKMLERGDKWEVIGRPWI